MKKHLNGINILMLSVLLCSGACYASETSNITEVDTISLLAEQNTFTTDQPGHDPFKPIITKKEIKLSRVELPEKFEKIVKDPPVITIEPLTLKVTGICGNDTLRQAVINHKNEEFTVKSGQTINGIFKIVDITDEKIVVYAIKEARRHSFTLAPNQ